MSATRDEVRARSEAKMAGGLTVFCGDCAMVFPHSGLPCRKHATPEESAAIDEHLRGALAQMALQRGAHVEDCFCSYCNPMADLP